MLFLSTPNVANRPARIDAAPQPHSTSPVKSGHIRQQREMTEIWLLPKNTALLISSIWWEYGTRMNMFGFATAYFRTHPIFVKALPCNKRACHSTSARMPHATPVFILLFFLCFGSQGCHGNPASPKNVTGSSSRQSKNMAMDEDQKPKVILALLQCHWSSRCCYIKQDANQEAESTEIPSPVAMLQSFNGPMYQEFIIDAANLHHCGKRKHPKAKPAHACKIAHWICQYYSPSSKWLTWRDYNAPRC